MEKFIIVKKEVLYSKFQGKIISIIGHFPYCFNQTIFEVRFDFPEYIHPIEHNYHVFYFRNYSQALYFLNRFSKPHTYRYFVKYHNSLNSLFSILLIFEDNAINRFTMRCPRINVVDASVDEIIDFING